MRIRARRLGATTTSAVRPASDPWHRRGVRSALLGVCALALPATVAAAADPSAPSPRSAVPPAAAAAPAAPALAATIAGRWEGEIQIPGAALPLVLDLGADGTGVARGAVTLPGRGISGAPLADLRLEPGGLDATLAAAFPIPQQTTPRLKLRVSADGGRLVGRFLQAGLEAPVELLRRGPPQFEPPRPLTPISPRLLGRWTGRYELGGYPRQVTLDLGREQSQMVIVGRRTTTVPFDLVDEGPHVLALEAPTFAISVELAHRGPRLEGTFRQGPFEAALVLERGDGSASPAAPNPSAAPDAAAGTSSSDTTTGSVAAPPSSTRPGRPASSASPSMFRGGPSRNGVEPAAAPRTLRGVKWSFATGARIVSSPAFADGLVVVGSDDGSIYAVEAESGRLRWRHRTRGAVASSPAIVEGRVYIVSYDGRLHALQAADGAPVWSFASAGERRFEARGLHGMEPRQQTMSDPYDVFLSSPLVVGGRVFVGSGDGNVYALDAATGVERWRFRTDDVVHASPAYADGTVVVGSWDSRIYGLDAETGAERWRFQAGTDALMHNQVGFQSSPAIADGVVYVGCRDSHLYALDARTGGLRWKFPTGASWVVGSPAVADGRVYFATSDSSLVHVVDAATGAALHEAKAKAYMFSSPVLAGDVLLIGVLDGTLEARARADLAPLWTFRTEASTRNLGWVLDADGRFNPALTFPSGWQDATVAGTLRQGSVGSIFSTPLVRDGVVYVGSADGRLYALW